MTKIVMLDPEVHRKDAPVDTRGRVTIGRELAGKSVTVVAEVEDE